MDTIAKSRSRVTRLLKRVTIAWYSSNVKEHVETETKTAAAAKREGRKRISKIQHPVEGTSRTHHRKRLPKGIEKFGHSLWNIFPNPKITLQ